MALAKECLADRTTGGFGGCEFCAGSHAKELHDAGCHQPQIKSFCNSAPSPGCIKCTQTPPAGWTLRGWTGTCVELFAAEQTKFANGMTKEESEGDPDPCGTACIAGIIAGFVLAVAGSGISTRSFCGGKTKVQEKMGRGWGEGTHNHPACTQSAV